MSARELPFLWSPSSPAVSGVAFSSATADGMSREAQGAFVPNARLQDVQLFEGVFTPTECEHIRSIARSRAMWEGRCTADEPDYRKCLTSWLEHHRDSKWIFDRCAKVVLAANEALGFDLQGFGEPLHYVEYDPQGGFDWHSDLGPGRASNRKLSVSIQLSRAGDYSGGELELCPHGVLDGFRQQGSAVAFPAYVPHKVHRVTAGRRDALICWIHGPAFR